MACQALISPRWRWPRRRHASSIVGAGRHDRSKPAKGLHQEKQTGASHPPATRSVGESLRVYRSPFRLPRSALNAGAFGGALPIGPDRCARALRITAVSGHWPRDDAFRQGLLGFRDPIENEVPESKMRCPRDWRSVVRPAVLPSDRRGMTPIRKLRVLRPSPRPLSIAARKDAVLRGPGAWNRGAGEPAGRIASVPARAGTSVPAGRDALRRLRHHPAAAPLLDELPR